ncbi:MAG: molybdenum cofactor biosynthesis protein MoaE [Methylococcaceae bacterium]|nr:molybdenum cofactor biosynthesis protein MoaE [Methylococcaceae bacterium]
MKVEVCFSALEPWAEIRSYQERRKDLDGKFGATACFIGTMRDFNDGDGVSRMTLEHYPGMTQRHLEKIAAHATERFPVLDVLLIHRVGELSPNDPIVVVAVWSAHRGAAFDACRAIMEELKSTAPFWKKEILETGARWVAKNTPG